MKARLLLLALACVIAVCDRAGIAGDAPKAGNEVREEMKRLEGEWKVVAAEMDGAAVESKTVVKFAGGKCILTESDPGLPTLELAVVLDPGKEPKWMDVTNLLKKTHRGIYELKGDTLKAVFRPDEKGERPTEFKTKKGSGLIMYTYERVKAK